MPQALWHRNRARALTDGVRRLSDLPIAEARAELLDCCDSVVWADRMLSQRPFKDRDELFAAAERFWEQLGASAPDPFATVRQRLAQLLDL